MSDTINPYKNLVLDKEEAAIEKALEKSIVVSSNNFEEVKKQAELAAKQHIKLQASKPITIRVKQDDLIKIKAKAKRNNIPYQTLLGVVLHDFAESSQGITIK